MMTAKLVTLIFTEVRVGKGTADDPARLVHRLWTADGRPVAVFDAHKPIEDDGPRGLSFEAMCELGMVRE